MEPYPAPPFWHTLALGKPSSSVSFSLSAAPFILSNSSLSSVAPERREKGVSLQSQGWKGLWLSDSLGALLKHVGKWSTAI